MCYVQWYISGATYKPMEQMKGGRGGGYFEKEGRNQSWMKGMKKHRKRNATWQNV